MHKITKMSCFNFHVKFAPTKTSIVFWARKFKYIFFWVIFKHCKLVTLMTPNQNVNLIRIIANEAWRWNWHLVKIILQYYAKIACSTLISKLVMNGWRRMLCFLTNYSSHLHLAKITEIWLQLGIWDTVFKYRGKVVIHFVFSGRSSRQQLIKSVIYDSLSV